MASKKKNKDKATEGVSFRLTPELMDELEAYARKFEGETGRTLTAGQAARRLVLAALRPIPPQEHEADQ